MMMLASSSTRTLRKATSIARSITQSSNKLRHSSLSTTGTATNTSTRLGVLEHRLSELQLSLSSSKNNNHNISSGSSTSSYSTTLIRHVSSSASPATVTEIETETSPPGFLVHPPNLKIDPRAISSPFYNLKKKEKVSVASSTQIPNEDDDYDNDEDDFVDLEEEAEGILYELEGKDDDTPYAIPLPQRLHVSILDVHTLSNLQRESESDVEAGTIHLSPTIFGQTPVRTDILHRTVIYQRNKKRGRRNPGAITKTISTRSGSGKKMRPQKGGGTARAGHKRPPHWRGGAKAHGPKGKVQNYETKLNKKVRRLGLVMALSQKLMEGNLILVNGWEGLETYRTKVLVKVLEGLGDIGGKYGTTAYVVDHVDESDVDEDNEDEEENLVSVGGIHVNLKVASGNIKKVKVANQRNLNVYDILKHEKLVLSLSALQQIEARMDA